MTDFVTAQFFLTLLELAFQPWKHRVCYRVKFFAVVHLEYSQSILTLKTEPVRTLAKIAVTLVALGRKERWLSKQQLLAWA